MKRKSVSWSKAVKSIFSPVRKKRVGTKLGLELLDTRIVPATFGADKNLADGALGSLTLTGGTGSLRRALDQANNNNDATNTIILNAGTHNLTIPNGGAQENANVSGDLDIVNNKIGTIPVKTYIFTGAGPGATIVNANDIDRVFQIVGPGVVVRFQNMTITGGHAVDDGTDGVAPGFAGGTDSKGGGVLNSGGGDVFFTNVAVTGNTAGNSAGATTLLNGGSGSGTLGQTGGGAGKAGKAGASGKSAYGGGIYSANGTITITGAGSKIAGNVASAGNGGSGGNGDFANVTGKIGGAGGDGGAGGNAYGGGVYAEAGAVVVNGGALIQSNTANAGAGGFGGNGGSASKANGIGGKGGAGGAAGESAGGGIFVANGSVTVSGAEVSKNNLNAFLQNGIAGRGGNGGFGGDATASKGVGGKGGAGGAGGSSYGGGIAIVSGDVTLAGGAIVNSNEVAAQTLANAGGNGGFGGAGKSTNGVGGAGGNGGNGGKMMGGGIWAGNGAVAVSGGSKVNFNAVGTTNSAGRGGAGGTAGSKGFVGGAGGNGGNGGDAAGGGVYVATGSFSLQGGATISSNSASGGTGGNGQNGGKGSNANGIGGKGGNGGIGGSAYGGGVYIGTGDVSIGGAAVISGNSIDGLGGGSGGDGGSAPTTGRGGAGGNGGLGGVGYGGGLYAGNGKVSVEAGATFVSNSAEGGDGGSGGSGGDGAVTGGDAGHGASGGKGAGGAIYVATGSIALTTGAKIINNDATGGDAGTGGNGGSGSAVGGAGGDGGAGGSAAGGGIAIAAGDVSIDGGAIVSSNSAIGSHGGNGGDGGDGKNAGRGGRGGDGGDAHGGGVWVLNGNVTIGGFAQFVNNFAFGSHAHTGGSGGDGSIADGAGGDGGNGGDGEGGALWVQDGSVTISGTSLFQGNGASGSSGGDNGQRGSSNAGSAPNGNGGAGGSGRGGAIYVGAANLTVGGNTNFIQNFAFGSDGGDASNNNAGGLAGLGGAGGEGVGGAIYAGTGNVNVQTVGFVSNSAGGNDGGNGGNTGNGTGRGGDGGLSAGGAIAVIGGNLTINAGAFQQNAVGNSADGGNSGVGGIGGDGGDALGGAVYAPASAGNVIVVNSSFFQNRAGGNVTTFSGNTLGLGTGNFKAGDGGGGAAKGGDSRGGAIYSAAASVLIQNSTVARNAVGPGGTGGVNGVSDGGGVYINSPAGRITNSTIVENRTNVNNKGQTVVGGQGGGVRNEGKLEFISNIAGQNNFVAGAAVGTARDISNTGGTVTGTANLVEDGTGGFVLGAGNIVGKSFINPAFHQSLFSGPSNTVYVNDPLAGNTPGQAPNGTFFFRLVTPAEFQGSLLDPQTKLPAGALSALDVGANPDGLTTDQIGNPRLDGTQVDAGAIEGNGAVVDVTGAFITKATFSGIAPNTVDKATVTFNESMQTGTFGPGDVTLVDPLGNIIPVTSVTPQAGSTTVFDIVFPSQTTFGVYNLTIGVDILDQAGNLMNQNLNKINGEVPPTSPDDLYRTTYLLFDVNDKTGANITSAVFSGAPGSFSQVLVTFNEGIDPTSISKADFTVTDPAGAGVIITGVNPVAGTQNKFTVTFAPQSTFGQYTIAAGVNILDFAGNQMNQNLNAVNGEPGVAPVGDEFNGTQSLFDPNDTDPPTVTLADFGPGAGTFNTIHLTFSEPVQVSTVTTTTVILTGPGGPITFTPADIVPVLPVAGAATEFDINFPAQTTFGLYTVTVTTGVRDARGNLPMAADFTTSEFLTDPNDTTPPTVTGVVFAPGGTTLSSATITFSEPVQAATVTSSVTLAGPGGAVTPLTVTPNATSTVFTVTFATQTAAGDYTLTVGTGVLDFGGNALQAEFTQTTTITGLQAPLFAIGNADGTVQIYNSSTGGAPVATVRPLDVSATNQYTGLIQVAMGDLNNDGTDDLWVSAANAIGVQGLDATKAGKVFVYDGTTLTNATPTLLRSFTPFATTSGPAGNTDPYTNGINIAVADINGDGTVDLVAGTRGGNGANLGRREIGRLAVIDGTSPAGANNLIGSIINPFGPGYEKGVVVAAGNVDGVGGAEIGVTRGGPVASPNPAVQQIKLKVVQLQGGNLVQLPLAANGDTAFAPFAGLTGPANAINRDGRVAFVDTDGNGKAEVVFSALDPLTSANAQVRVAVYSINTAATQGAASIVSTGPDQGTYLTGTAVTDHATTHVPATGTTENLALLTNSANSGIVYLAPLTGTPATTPTFTGFTILAGGITIDGV